MKRKTLLKSFHQKGKTFEQNTSIQERLVNINEALETGKHPVTGKPYTEEDYTRDMNMLKPFLAKLLEGDERPYRRRELDSLAPQESIFDYMDPRDMGDPEMQDYINAIADPSKFKRKHLGKSFDVSSMLGKYPDYLNNSVSFQTGNVSQEEEDGWNPYAVGAGIATGLATLGGLGYGGYRMADKFGRKTNYTGVGMDLEDESAFDRQGKRSPEYLDAQNKSLMRDNAINRAKAMDPSLLSSDLEASREFAKTIKENQTNPRFSFDAEDKLKEAQQLSRMKKELALQGDLAGSKKADEALKTLVSGLEELSDSKKTTKKAGALVKSLLKAALKKQG